MIVLENEITFTIMIQESKTGGYAFNNEIVTDTSLYHTKKGKVTPPDIIYPVIMEECKGMIHSDNIENGNENSLYTLC